MVRGAAGAPAAPLTMDETTRITYVGHGTLLIESRGRRLLTDPLLRRWAAPLRRYTPLPSPSVRGDLDAVLLSHLHIDHVDVGSLRLLDRRTPVLVPPPGATTLRRLGFRDVREIGTGESFTFGEVTVETTPARHVVKRYPLVPVSDGVGFLVRGTHTVYYAGDTGPFTEMADIASPLDVALLPISGWGPTLNADEHLTPLAAARCLGLLRPALAVPVHWGTYYPPAMSRLWRGDTRRPALLFTRYARKLAADVEVRILDPGEATVVQPVPRVPATRARG
jgi:L-ascorbate metabolism protein UlaG (beta-lactamase superfamily)